MVPDLKKTKIDYDNYHLSTAVDFIYQKDFLATKEANYISYQKDYKEYLLWNDPLKILDTDIIYNEVKKLMGDLKDNNLYTIYKEVVIDSILEKNKKDILDYIDLNEKDVIGCCVTVQNELRYYFYTKKISSKYYYGKDEEGEYIIRESDHWGDVASCKWNLKIYDENGDLFHVENTWEEWLIDEEDGTESVNYHADVVFGKAYLKDFKTQLELN